MSQNDLGAPCCVVSPKLNMRKCSSTILYAAYTFRPYKSTPVLKLFRTFTGRMTRGLSLRMVFSLLFQDTLLFTSLMRIGFLYYNCLGFDLASDYTDIVLNTV